MMHEHAVFQPTTFGKYFLTRRLAVGGMAEVFAAKLYGADGFEKDLVIKQILPQYAKDPEFVQSFVAEAKIVVTLNHANIVGIYELGRVGGTYFIAMEYVDGLDVFDFIDAVKRDKGRIDIGSALLITEEVAKGLDYAHRKRGPDGLPLDLVHRDLNPRNVLVSREGDVKILDFGIAKIGSKIAEMPKTRAGVVKGTSGYMSPEQATGREVDARTDIYQAGLLLFEVLTQKALFWRPDDQETRRLMQRHEIIRPSELVYGIPEEVDRLIFDTLAKDPQKRIKTGAELGARIAKIRLNHFPDAQPRNLGDQVGRLLDGEAARQEVVERKLPSTQDLSAMISEALQETNHGFVETIATRAPSEQPGRAKTGTTPLDVDETEQRVIEAAPVTPVAPQALSAMKRPTRAKLLPAGVMMLLMGGAAGVWLRGQSEPPPPLPPLDTQRAAAPPRSDVPPQDAHLRPASDPSPSGPPQGLSPVDANPLQPTTQDGGPKTTPSATPTKAAPEEPQLVATSPKPSDTLTPTRPRPRALAQASSTVSFGSDCPARVLLDGKLIGRSTPIHDFEISPGKHRVHFDGPHCLSSAASLKSRPAPIVRGFTVKEGARLKIIARFKDRSIRVVRVPQ